MTRTTPPAAAQPQCLHPDCHAHHAHPSNRPAAPTTPTAPRRPAAPRSQHRLGIRGALIIFLTVIVIGLSGIMYDQQAEINKLQQELHHSKIHNHQ